MEPLLSVSVESNALDSPKSASLSSSAVGLPPAAAAEPPGVVSRMLSGLTSRWACSADRSGGLIFASQMNGCVRVGLPLAKHYADACRSGPRTSNRI
eukprot:SAG11_NODE_1030_length_6119_cov_7.559302_2_plen_97_part_00